MSLQTELIKQGDLINRLIDKISKLGAVMAEKDAKIERQEIEIEALKKEIRGYA